MALIVALNLPIRANVLPAVTESINFESATVRLSIGADGGVKGVADKVSGTNYADLRSSPAFVRLKIDGRMVAAKKAVLEQGLLTFTFGDVDARVVLRCTESPSSILVEVMAVEGADIQECIFAYVPLTLKGVSDEPFAACALALTLNTRVPQLPGLSNFLDARCYPRFGFKGAKVALVGGTPTELRGLLQVAIKSSPELPHSPIGGPWALDAEINRGSYLFARISEENADEWIKLAQRLGISQLDFDGMSRYGDSEPFPNLYPNGIDGLKEVVRKVHAAGLKAGLHTYAFFMDKRCPWVTPVPDARLGKDAVFTLDADLDDKGKAIVVTEPTADVSAITGFFVRNSATLQIDDELMVFSGASQAAPYTFTISQRGANGTKISAHAKGAKVYKLKECFGRFAPDPDSTLLAEVAAQQAKVVNTCGFDMMYIDALDGEDVLSGRENGWHEGAKFVFELWKGFDHPVLLEMSTMHHHLWRVRSRMGAWDHPSRSHKQFIDLHAAANKGAERMFLPMHLGWWGIKFWTGPQGEPTFPDVIEYLCCQAIGSDVGFSMQGIRPGMVERNATMRRLADIMRNYETLRHANSFSPAIKEKLREPGAEFTLDQSADGHSVLRPAEYASHLVDGREQETSAWTMTNTFGQQPLRLRMEVMMSAAEYNDTNAVVMADFKESAEFGAPTLAKGVTATLAPESKTLKDGLNGGCLTLSNSLPMRVATWAGFGKTFASPLNLGGERALGLWVHGDGQGAVLNFQLKCPSHVVAGLGEHYVDVDFKGWRYFELIESDAGMYSTYKWPYGGMYAIYRERIDYRQIQEMKLWVNNLPAKGTSTLYISQVRALPLQKATIRNPRVTIDGCTLSIPAEMESGCYLEFDPDKGCTVYKPDGNILKEIAVAGEIPILKSGENRLIFACDSDAGVSPRVKITVFSTGTPLQE